MRAAGVPAELRVRDGVHNWEYWHLALLADALAWLDSKGYYSFRLHSLEN